MENHPSRNRKQNSNCNCCSLTVGEWQQKLFSSSFGDKRSSLFDVSAGDEEEEEFCGFSSSLRHLKPLFQPQSG
jgi:hypothetical protein